MTATIKLATGGKKMIDIEPAREGKHILIYADGSCFANPGPGGHAASLRRMNGATQLKRRTVVGFEPAQTTNVRMEMTAAAAALEALKPGEPEPIVIYSDNRLIPDGMNGWVHTWIANGWRKSDKKLVENRDLWERLLAASEGKSIEWRWVRGHAGHALNEEVDRLAKEQTAIARSASYGFAA